MGSSIDSFVELLGVDHKGNDGLSRRSFMGYFVAGIGYLTAGAAYSQQPNVNPQKMKIVSRAIASSLFPALERNSSQGGHLTPPGPSEKINGFDVPIIDKKNTLPSIEDYEDGIKKFTNFYVPHRIQQFTNGRIKSGDVKSNMDLKIKKGGIEIFYDIEVDGESIFSKGAKNLWESKSYDMYHMAKDIIGQESDPADLDIEKLDKLAEKRRVAVYAYKTKDHTTHFKIGHRHFYEDGINILGRKPKKEKNEMELELIDKTLPREFGFLVNSGTA